MRAAVLDQHGFIERGIRGLDDIQVDGFTTALIRHTDNGAFADTCAIGNNYLHLVGVNVEARDNDQILFAIDDLE
ncbi:hypothetical protein D3C78_1572940 [compost metagenome]